MILEIQISQFIFSADIHQNIFQPLRKRCSYLELFWSAFSRIQNEYREILRIFPYALRMQKNTGHNNSKYRQFYLSERVFSKEQNFKNIFSRNW